MCVCMSSIILVEQISLMFPGGLFVCVWERDRDNLKLYPSTLPSEILCYNSENYNADYIDGRGDIVFLFILLGLLFQYISLSLWTYTV